MNKLVSRLVLPLMLVSTLAGCNQTKTVNLAELAVKSNVLLNEGSGEWINDDYYSYRVKYPETLAYSTYVYILNNEVYSGTDAEAQGEPKIIKVPITYAFDAETAAKWKEGPIGITEKQKRRLTPEYKENGSDFTSTITLTATYNGKSASVSYTLDVIDQVVTPVSLSKIHSGDIKKGDALYTQGVITYTYADNKRNGIFVADGEHAVLVYDKSYAIQTMYDSLTVGTYIKFKGTLDSYNGLYEIYPTECSIITEADQKAKIKDPVTFEATYADWKNTKVMENNTSRFVNFYDLEVTEALKNVELKPLSSSKNVKVVAYNPDDSSESTDVTINFNYHIGQDAADSIAAKLATLNVGDRINIMGGIVGMYSTPQIQIISGDNIVLAAA